MIKIILTSILYLAVSISVNAQSKSFAYYGKENNLKSQQTKASVSYPKTDALLLATNAISPKRYSEIKKIINTPSESAGTNLKHAGQMLLWGTIASSVGQTLILIGEPGTGILLSIAGTVLTFSGYQNITKAGKNLEQSTNN